MNIILSAKEKHPVEQADICPSLDLTDKKVLFVFGLANSKGENKVYSYNDAFGDGFLRLHALTQYYYEDAGEDTPNIVQSVSDVFMRQGFEVAIVGISKNVRREKDAATYAQLLKELHEELLG